jgi:hypothetical protein
VFAPVAGHPATVQALAAAHRELREVAEGELDAIAGCGEPIASDLVRLHRRVTGLLAADWYDTTDLRRAAAAVLHDEPRRGREIGEVVLFLPQELSPSATALLQELPARLLVNSSRAVRLHCGGRDVSTTWHGGEHDRRRARWMP